MPGARGFASMDAEKQREIASKGGKAAHIKGTAHEFTPEEARVAGSKGGRAARQKRLLRELEVVRNPEPVESKTNGPIPFSIVSSGDTNTTNNSQAR